MPIFTSNPSKYGRRLSSRQLGSRPSTPKRPSGNASSWNYDGQSLLLPFRCITGKNGAYRGECSHVSGLCWGKVQLLLPISTVLDLFTHSQTHHWIPRPICIRTTTMNSAKRTHFHHLITLWTICPWWCCGSQAKMWRRDWANLCQFSTVWEKRRSHVTTLTRALIVVTSNTTNSWITNMPH